MIYFLKGSCISPEPSADDSTRNEHNWLTVAEPAYEGIPKGKLRRMGKALRIGVGAALPIIESYPNISGIILGSANGGMEDCVKFLNQVIEFDEGTLTPTNFVQSTSNAIAGHIGLMSKNIGHNATHVHRGLSFENALLDASFQCRENPDAVYLVGGVDEISQYNYNIDFLAGWYKPEKLDARKLYASNTPGSLAGEGAAMFAVSAQPEGAIMKLSFLKTMYSNKPADLVLILNEVISRFEIDTLISGENGDVRIVPFYDHISETLPDGIAVMRYKHYTGEFQTSTALATNACLDLFAKDGVPNCFDIKRKGNSESASTVLIYNAYHGTQHSFMVFEKV